MYEVRKLFKEGEELHDECRYEEAIKKFDEVLALDDRHLGAYCGKGHMLTILGDFDAAIKIFDESISLYPSESMPYVGKGQALFLSGENDLAIATLEKAIELAPDHDHIYCILGSIFVALDQYESSIKIIDKAIKLNPENSDAYSMKAFCLNALGKYQLAIDEYDKIIKFDPSCQDACGKKGNILKGLARYDEAIAAYTQALAFEKSYLYYCNRAIIYQKIKKRDLALKDFKAAEKLLDEAKCHGMSSEGALSIQKILKATIKIQEYTLRLKKTFDDLKAKSFISLEDSAKFEKILENIDGIIDSPDFLSSKSKLKSDFVFLSSKSKLKNDSVEQKFSALMLELEIIEAKFDEIYQEHNELDKEIKYKFGFMKESYGDLELEPDHKLSKMFTKTLNLRSNSNMESHLLSFNYDPLGDFYSADKALKKNIRGKSQCNIFTLNDIKYDNQLLNYPELLDHCSRFLGLKNCLDLGSGMSSDLLREASDKNCEASDNNYDLALAALISLQDNFES
jgi:tetratricopeptide (TPR) repeat protein